jgi:hypothetical protein
MGNDDAPTRGPVQGVKSDDGKARWDKYEWQQAAWAMGQNTDFSKENFVPSPLQPRHDLLPKVPMDEVARVLAFGGLRYGDNNWQYVPEARRRYFAAAIRHLVAWWLGEKHDRDSGAHPLAHAVACCLFLIYFDRTDAGMK